MDFRHCLEHERTILASVERFGVLAQRFAKVALLPEGEAEVELRELAFGLHLHRGDAHRRARRRRLYRFPLLRAPLFDGEVRVRARQRGIELNGAPRDFARLLVQAEVAEHEAHEIVRVGIVRIELDGTTQRGERALAHAAIVQDLADVEVDDRTGRIEREPALQISQRLVQITIRALGESELDQRTDVGRVVSQQRSKLRDGVGRLPEQRVGAAKFPVRIAIAGQCPQSLRELTDTFVVIAGVEVGDLEVALRHQHFCVELQRAHEGAHRLLVQSLVVIQHAEIVVRTGIRRINAAGERAQHIAVAFGGERGSHPSPLACSRHAHRAQDRLERCGIRQQQKEPTQLLAYVVHEELALHTEHIVLVRAELEIGGGEHRRAHVDGE